MWLILPVHGPGGAETCRSWSVDGEELLPQESVIRLITTTVSHLTQNLQQGCTNFPKCRGHLTALAVRR